MKKNSVINADDHHQQQIMDRFRTKKKHDHKKVSETKTKEKNEKSNDSTSKNSKKKHHQGEKKTLKKFKQ